MHIDARKRLAASQLELVRALVGNEIAPAEFDGPRIQAAADALLLKRSRSVAHAWPGLARSLGPAFDERFALYASSKFIRHEGGPLADGREFAHELAREGALADDAVLEALAFDLRYDVSLEGALARRGISFRGALLKQSLRLIIAIRLPLLGERWFSVPLKIFLQHHASGSV